MTAERKPCLLLLPGLLLDARLWRHQVAGLSDISLPLVADLTGADSMAMLASQALSQVPVERFVLAGLSMGGYVALEMMRQAPERVDALALLDTTARPDTAEASDNRCRLMARAESDFEEVVDTLLHRYVHPARVTDPQIAGIVADMGRDLGRDVFLRQQRAIIDRIDSRPFLPRIRCPTLVLCGRDDAVAPVEVHEEMADAIPGAGLIVVEHCGHLSPLERPRPVTKALRAWLGSLAARLGSGP